MSCKIRYIFLNKVIIFENCWLCLLFKFRQKGLFQCLAVYPYFVLLLRRWLKGLFFLIAFGSHEFFSLHTCTNKPSVALIGHHCNIMKWPKTTISSYYLWTYLTCCAVKNVPCFHFAPLAFFSSRQLLPQCFFPLGRNLL